MFDSFSYEETDLNFSHNEYVYVLSQYFFDELKGFNNVDEIDSFLGWPKNFSSVFFPHIYEKPFSKSINALGQSIGFNNLRINSEIVSDRISLEKVPIECPHCHSKNTVKVLAGYPGVLDDPEKYYIYGCCVDGIAPEWYCKDCKSFIYQKNKKVPYLFHKKIIRS